MLLRIELNIINPMAGTSRNLSYQFDPATMTQAKWSAAFPTVQGKINEVATDAGTNPNEPPVW